MSADEEVVSLGSREHSPPVSQPNRGTRAALVTLGCKINSFESAAMAQALAQDSWVIVDSSQTADLYVINSCTVTAEADRQTRQAVGRVLRENPSARVVLTGCYAQNDPERCAEIPGVSLVVGNDQKNNVAPLVRDLLAGQGKTPAIHVDRLTGLPPALLRGYEDHTRAFVQVQQGCDQACTFCVIHRARGPSYSFAQADILKQVHEFLDSGYRELVICGVDLGSYEHDATVHPETSLALVNLLRKIASVPGEFRIRLSSIDPVHLTDDLLDLIGSDARFCPYLHVSVQSGSTLILKRMKRRYDREFLIGRLAAARDKINGLVLGADIMAGFPTESDGDFEATASLVQEANIIYPHVFPFSARPGTPAAKIPKQIPKPERKRRAAELRRLGGTLRQSALEKMRGANGSLLVEREVIASTSVAYHGRLQNYMPVRLESGDAASGEMRSVHISGVASEVLIARVNGSA